MREFRHKKDSSFEVKQSRKKSFLWMTSAIFGVGLIVFSLNFVDFDKALFKGVNTAQALAAPTNPDQDVADDWIGYAKNPQRTGYSPVRISPALNLKMTINEPSGYHLGALHSPGLGDNAAMEARLRSWSGTLGGRITGKSLDGYGYHVYFQLWNAYSGAVKGGAGGGWNWTAWHSAFSSDGLISQGGGEHSGGVSYQDSFQDFGTPPPCQCSRTGPREATVYNGAFYNGGSCYGASSYATYTPGYTRGGHCTGAGRFDTRRDSVLWSHSLSDVNNVYTFVDNVMLEFNRDLISGSTVIPSLNAFDAATGTQLWKKDNVGYSSGENGSVYFGDLNGAKVYKANAKTGNILWSTSVNTGGFKNDADEGAFPVVGESLVIFNGANKIVALDKNSGVVKWTYDHAISGKTSYAVAMALSKDILYFTLDPVKGNVYYGERNGNLYAIDTNTGSVIMTKSGKYSDVIIANKMLYVVRQTGTYYIDPKVIEVYAGAAPTARINKNLEVINVESGKSFSMDASASFASAGNTLTRYVWDMGDGNKLEGKTVNHIYAPVSELTEKKITLTVTDNQGNVGEKIITAEIAPADDAQKISQNIAGFKYTLVRDNFGNLIIFYNEGNNDYYNYLNELVYKVSTDKGKTWSAATKIGAGNYSLNALVDKTTNDIYLVGHLIPPYSKILSTEPPSEYWFYKLKYAGNNGWNLDVSKKFASSGDKNNKNRFVYIMKDSAGTLWSVLSGGSVFYDVSINIISSSDDGQTWSSPKILLSSSDPISQTFSAFLWNDKPTIIYDTFLDPGVTNDSFAGYAIKYWDGSAFQSITPANPKAYSAYLNGRSLSAFNLVVNPADQSLDLIYKDMAQFDFQRKDGTTNNNWQRMTRKVTPTHGTMPDDNYPFLSSDGVNTYLLYGEWRRRDDVGYHYNIALKKYDPNNGWQAGNTYIIQDSQVNSNPITIQDARGMDYLPVIWQEKDNSGNYYLKYKAVSIAVSPDTQKPTAPSNLAAIPASTSKINLSWSASTDNVAVAGYNIYRDGVKIGTSTSSVYTDSGLSAKTQYTYAIEAFDAAGNVSEKSSSATASTSVVSYSIVDFAVLAADWLQAKISSADVNADNQVDARDLGIMMSHWKQ